MTMKIVIDTNVVLPALMSVDGVSNTLVTEYEDALLREKHRKFYPQFSKEEITSFIDDICLISYHQKINFLWRPFLRDIKDDMLLETAFNGNCNYIITYNLKDFKGVKEKVASLKTLDYLTQRAESGSKDHAISILKRASSYKPDSEDLLD